MANVIVAFSRQEDAANIKKILIRSGFSVVSACTCGAQVLAEAEALGGGIVVCGCRLKDMEFIHLAEDLPLEFGLVMVSAPGRHLGRIPDRVWCLSSPLKIQELVETLRMVEEQQERRRRNRKNQPVKRTKAEKQTLAEAKELLMRRKKMTEEEAHRYIQKRSMDNGVGMLETAQMVLQLMK